MDKCATFHQTLQNAGLSLERVPRVPDTRKILSSFLMAPVNFYKISREQLPGTRKILRSLMCGTHGLKFLTTPLYTLVGREAAKILEVKVWKGWKNLPVQPGVGASVSNRVESATFLSISKFDLFTYKNVQHLIWEIWFISIWSQKPKTVVWLLMCFALAQITPISYHTEAKECIFFDAVLF